MADATSDPIRAASPRPHGPPSFLARLERPLAWLLPVVAVIMSLFQLVTVDFRFVGYEAKSIIHVAFVIAVIALSRGLFLKPEVGRVRIDAVLVLFVVAVTTVYAFIYFYEAAENPVRRPIHELVLSIVMIVLVLTLCRRIGGWPMTIVVLGFFAYALFSDYAPGVFSQRGLSWQRLTGRLYLTQEGIYGPITRVSATFVFVFILFGSFLDRSGAGEFYSRVAQSIFGTAQGGAAKVAVAASAFFAMLSGSALANMASTGQITIPMMKRAGYRPEFAAAVEAVASLGGEVTPPVMAGSVFIMIAILGISYGTVARAAALVSVLFYLSVYLSVHAEACKRGLKGLSRAEVPPMGATLREGWFFFIPLILLLSLLIVWDYPAERAGLLAVLSIPAVLFFTNRRMSLTQIFEGLREGALLGSTIGVLIITAQLITSLVNFTGLGLTFSERLISLAGEDLVPLMFVCFFSALILGMGLPAVTTYVILAVMVAPAMIKAGAVPLAAHMFVLYAAMNALITPPVAAGAMLTSGIAGASFMKTCWESMRLAISKFVLPFMFVLNPALLLEGDLQSSIWAATRAAVAIVAAVVALQGWGLKRATVLERVLFGVGTILLVAPDLLTDLLAFGMIALASVIHVVRHAEPEPETEPASPST
ncbi:MAG: TRAP transporter fused permease subunit [Chloroflexi bacterium]|nr:TRAP transporter fused permease subunit [Chloroflexota bacterium]